MVISGLAFIGASLFEAFVLSEAYSIKFCWLVTAFVCIITRHTSPTKARSQQSACLMAILAFLFIRGFWQPDPMLSPWLLVGAACVGVEQVCYFTLRGAVGALPAHQSCARARTVLCLCLTGAKSA